MRQIISIMFRLLRRLFPSPGVSGIVSDYSIALCPVHVVCHRYLHTFHIPTARVFPLGCLSFSSLVLVYMTSFLECYSSFLSNSIELLNLTESIGVNYVSLGRSEIVLLLETISCVSMILFNPTLRLQINRFLSMRMFSLRL